MVGWDFEEGLTIDNIPSPYLWFDPSSILFGRGICLITGIFTAHSHEVARETMRGWGITAIADTRHYLCPSILTRAGLAGNWGEPERAPH